MRNTEKRARQTAKRAHIQDAVLLYFHSLGNATTGVLTPGANVSRVLRAFDPAMHRKRNVASRVREAAMRLATAGLLKRNVKGGYILTKKGEARASLLASSRRVQLEKPPRWDGKWRIIMFDIWERRSAARKQLREHLRRVGFVRLQHSVWAYPYPCEDFTAFVRAELRLGGGMLYLVAEGVEGDNRLRKHFNLQ